MSDENLNIFNIVIIINLTSYSSILVFLKYKILYDDFMILNNQCIFAQISTTNIFQHPENNYII